MTHNQIRNGHLTVRAMIARLGRVRVLRRDLPGRLRAFSGTFAEHYERTDVEFNALAESLRHLCDLSQALARLVSERLGSVRTALNESRIARPEGMAATALHELRTGLTKTEGELALLQSVGENLWRLHSHVEQIERIGLVIRTSVFGFAVESARTERCRSTFGSFAGELRLLGDRITNLAAAINHHASAAHTTLEQEWKTLSASHAQLRQLAETLEATAGATAAAAQAMLDDVLQGLQQSEERMREITHQAGEALFHLQFGDIIRQKSEHIADALREAADQLNPKASGRAFGEQAAEADRAIAIQIGQLELIRTEVEAAQHKLADSFRTLGEATGQLCAILGRWHGAPEDPQDATDSLAAFKADLLRLENLHCLGQELRQGARRSIQKVAGVSQQLAGHADEVKTLNADLHLQALNAIVKTAALGDEGATLSVLSTHVDSLYSESNQIVTELVGILEAVLKKTLASSDSEVAAPEPDQNPGLRGGMEHIESAYNECNSTFASAHNLVEKQQTAVDGSQALLNFLAGQGPAITGQIGELTTFRELLAPCLPEARPSAMRDETSQDRYTMQSERDVHERAVRLAGPGTNTATGTNPEPLAPPRPNGNLAPAPAAAPNGSPESPVPGIISTNSTTAAVPDMGDNVELF